MNGDKVLITPSIEAFSGSLSSVLALTIIYPLDTVKIRIQVQNVHDKKGFDSLLDAFKKIISVEGPAGFYKGLSSNLINQGLNGYIYFYFYSYLRNMGRNLLKIPINVPISTPVELFIGAASGVLCQLVTLPLSVIATRQQTSSRDIPRPWSVIVRYIIRNDGFTGLWKGFGPAMILCSNPAITYSLFEHMKTMIINRKVRSGVFRDYSSGFLSSGEAFVIGALSKIVATVVTYPYISAKTRLMWTPTEEEIEAHGDDVIYTGTLDVLRKLFRLHGIGGWYKIIKAFITQALVLMFKENITRYIAKVLSIAKAISVARKLQ
ncbi:hypothetical protein BB559_000704 [Furculomyces boomerangus]|uniref:Uncharacterized protein n=1 Tax=Furculomyces boomerangus TaxID=61424 RepID=A0A2T9Z4J4_9FUNG|nr:hypothetical protein BB559_004532 [Furculomyces boomerangus]PVU99456.1 hypothetical protein BB559_000704 [Furculomyces boomerangus]